MFVGITNTPRDYAWGSSTAIAKVLGREPGGGPEAELWFGAHPGSPSHLVDSGRGGGAVTLDRLIRTDPAAALGPGRTQLPFLMKLLAADRPLSLQAHPNPEQARAGFAREQAAGLAIDAPTRNYKDESAKPELIVALSERFEALAGFRHVSETRLLLAELATASAGGDRAEIDTFSRRLAAGDPVAAGSIGSSADVHAVGMPDRQETTPTHNGAGNALRDVVAWLLERGDGVDRLVAAVTNAAAAAPSNSSFGREWLTVTLLANEFPGDPGIVLSLLLNRVSLAQGQALQLPAGNIHAYLSGTGVELMSASDNVLRGGLTKKHVDVLELLAVVDFQQMAAPIVIPDYPAPGITAYRADVDDFVLARIEIGEAGYTHGYQNRGPESTSFRLTGPAIGFCLSGGVRITGARDAAALARGDAVFISPDEGDLTFTGSGCVFVATTP